MKKLIVACFALMFLLGVVAGCTQSADGRSASGGGSAVDFSEAGGDPVVGSTDNSVEDIDISLE
jgi:hypothetical protein